MQLLRVMPWPYAYSSSLERIVSVITTFICFLVRVDFGLPLLADFSTLRIAAFSEEIFSPEVAKFIASGERVAAAAELLFTNGGIVDFFDMLISSA